MNHTIGMRPLARERRAAARVVPRARRTGFTLVEMLIVMAVIIVLLSLLIVGLNLATKTAQGANTTALMQSLSQGLVRFKEDVGYLPPILDRQRRLVDGPPLTPAMGGGGQYAGDIQDWYSITSLAEYLIGWDSGDHDGYGNVSTGESPFTGIRSPGPDGVWGAGPGGDVADRDPVTTGRVFGPYLELDNDRLLGAISDDGRIVFPGEVPEADFRSYPKVIVDYWGEPIEYFRRDYPAGAITQSYRAGIDYDTNGVVNDHDRPSLADVVRLRPYVFAAAAVRPDGTPIAGPESWVPDARGDTGVSFELQSAEFAVFSPGPDRVYDATIRYDAPEERNRDNKVEVGP